MKPSVPASARRFASRAIARSAAAFVFVAVVGGFGQVSVRAATPVVGGGFTSSGLIGEYFPNTTFAAPAAFTRRDVRIRFDWRESASMPGLPVGGAMFDASKNFPTDNFSVRWTGQIRARFTETYTFHLTGEDGLSFRIRPAGATDWSTLVDSLNASAVVNSTYDLTANQLYDIEFCYVDRANTGASRAILEWSSPSTPREVIDPIAVGQIAEKLGYTYSFGAKHADLVLDSEDKWRTAAGSSGVDVASDPLGWPTGTNAAKCQLGLANSGFYNGTYRFRFKGKAEVKMIGWNTPFTTAVFTVNGVNYTGLLPKGVGYGADGYTTATVTLNVTGGNLQFGINNAERNDGTPGITDLQFMAPIAQNSNTPHEFGEIATREARQTFQNFFTQRHQEPGLTHQGEYTWANRVPATYRGLSSPEREIIECNEQGHDLYFNFPVSWDQTAMLAFAKTIRYGSDGVNPYDHYVANPVFPPLNPNLRVYTEHANELPWAVYPKWIWNELHDKAVANDADWRIVNYDGGALNTGKALGNDTSDGALSTLGMYRYHALRMKQMSDALRTTYTDVPGAFGEIYRPLAFGQYSQSLLNTMLQFLDDYFNNADNRLTNRVDNPQPPRAYLWGGGGAIYYGTANKFGRLAVDPVQNNGFQSPVLNPGEARLRPTDAVWSFTGNAGVASVQLPRASLTLNSTGATASTPTTSVYAGFKFTVGPKDIYVYQLGRMCYSGNKLSHSLDIFDTAGNKLQSSKDEAYSTSVDFSKDRTVGAFNYAWTRVVTAGGSGYVKTITPIRLIAGRTYYFTSSEDAPTGAQPNPDTFADATTSVTAPDGITINAAVIGTDGKVWTETPGSVTYGPLNLVFTTQELSTTDGPVGVPADLSATPNPQTEKSFDTLFNTGSQCAFLTGTGTVKQTITVPEAGNYWVTWIMARDIAKLGTDVNNPGMTVRVKIDGVERFNQVPLYRSSWWYHATQVVSLSAGTHEISFEGTVANNNTVYIDDVRLGRDTEFFGGTDAANFPSGGGAFGQDPSTGYFKTAQAECDMANHWGLVPCTYEGGWAVQGDFDGGGMVAWSDLRYGSPLINPLLTKRALLNALSVWTRYGGYMYAYYYGVQSKISDQSAPLLQGVREMNDIYTMNVDTGLTAPVVLVTTQPHYEGGLTYAGPSYDKGVFRTDPDLAPREWKDWMVTIAASGLYRVTLSASGGQARLAVNDVPLAEGLASSGLNGTVFLTPGAHSIKVRAQEAITYQRIVVESAASPSVQVTGNGQLIADGDTVPALADGTSFGVILRNTTLDRTFVVKNLGTQPLTPVATLVGANTADFSIVTALPATLAGGAQANLVIRYSPTAVGGASATVRISHNGLAATQEFAIAGSAENSPVADAGPDQTTTDRPGVVTLDGTRSTGYAITPAWTQVSGPAVTLAGANTLTPTFPAGTYGTYVFQLAVNSPLGYSTDTVTVRITAGDVPAQVFAGHDVTVAPGGVVTLRGSATDVEGDAITYAWTQIGGPAVTITGANTATPTFNATLPGTYVFQLAATSNGKVSFDTVTITVASPLATLWWGGGTGTPSASITTNSDATFGTAMAGTWNTSTTNWNTSLTSTTGYQAWNSGNVAGLKSMFAGSGGSPDIALAADMTAAGIYAEFSANATNQNYEFISADATNRTLTLAPGAQVTLASNSSSVTLNVRRAGYVTGRGATILAGSGPVTFVGLASTGGPGSSPVFNIESASLSGPVRVSSGALNIGSTSTGATGLLSSPLVEGLGNLAAVRASYFADTDDRIGNSAALVLANAQFNLALASDAVSPSETVGSLTLEGTGALVANLGRATSPKTGTLVLANGLTRGDNGRGVLVTVNTTATGTNLGGLGVTTGNGFVLSGHGLGNNAVLPWGFNFGRAQTTTGGQTTTTSAAFLGTDATGKLAALPAASASADLASASWQAFTAAQDVSLDNATLVNAFAGPVTARTLAVTLAATGTLDQAGKTLAVRALGFGDNASRSFTLGNGTLTSSAGDLYVIHRRQNTNAASTLTLNSAISGACEVIFGGPNAQIALNADNTHTGATYVNAGKVSLGANGKFSATPLINLSEGSLLVSTSADYTLGGTTVQTLAGGGTWQLTTRTLTIGALGKIAPGDAGANDTLTFNPTTGKLAFAAGSVVALDLGAPGDSDALAFTTAGDWLVGSPTLALTLGAGFDYAKSYVIVRNAASDAFSFANITGYDTAQYVAYAGRAGNDIVLTFSKVPNLTPEIINTTLADATAGVAYSRAFEADNLDLGTVLTWSQPAGALPLGMTFGSSGVLSGTPAAGSQGTYAFDVRVVDSDNDANTKSVTLTVNPPAGSSALPSDRFAYVDDLGSGIVGDGRALSDGTLQIAGNGLGLDGVAAGSDSALYAEKTVTGDFRATVKINGLTGAAASRAGLMIRAASATPDAGARFVALGTGTGAGYVYSSRATANAAANAETVVQVGGVARADTFAKWLRLQRRGDTITLSVSADGVTYSLVDNGAITLANLGSSVQVGLYGYSGSLASTADARFSAYEIKPQDPDLVLHYTFDEGAGTQVGDIATGGNSHTTTVASATWTASGKFGAAYGTSNSTPGFPSFFPANQTDLNFDPRSQAFTISVWVKITGTSSYQTIFSKCGSTSTRQYQLWTGTGNSSLIAYSGGTTAPSLTVAPALDDGNWHLLTFVNFNSAGTWKTRLYYDSGATYREFSVGTIAPVTQLLRIGEVSTGYNRMLGFIDDFRVYKRALGSSEVGQLFSGQDPTP